VRTLPATVTEQNENFKNHDNKIYVTNNNPPVDSPSTTTVVVVIKNNKTLIQLNKLIIIPPPPESSLIFETLIRNSAIPTFLFKNFADFLK
jgi:hypothetical protein